MPSARRLAGLIALLVPLVLAATAARADSCWDHNGSLMRLSDSGQQRWLSYETTPHAWQGRAGVFPGTLLFDGVNRGDYYSGTARVFSRFCPGDPLEYYVEGPVAQNPLRIILRGARDVNDMCAPTGRMVMDMLVFTYVRDC